MRRDQENENNGKVYIDISSNNIVVGRMYCMKVTYIAGTKGILVGGSLRFKLPEFKLNEFRRLPVVCCSKPKVKLRCSNTLPVVNGKNGSEFFTIDYLFVNIENESLKEGETISVDYGMGTGSKYISAAQLAQKWKVEAGVDPDGSRNAPGSGFYVVKEAPVINFVSDKAARIEVTIPSITKIGEPFDTVVRVRDRCNNIVSNYKGRNKLGTSRSRVGKGCRGLFTLGMQLVYR